MFMVDVKAAQIREKPSITVDLRNGRNDLNYPTQPRPIARWLLSNVQVVASLFKNVLDFDQG